MNTEPETRNPERKALNKIIISIVFRFYKQIKKQEF